MLKINKYYIHLPDSENKNLEKYIYIAKILEKCEIPVKI